MMNSKKVVIFGGTGLIGTELSILLKNSGYEVFIVSRKKLSPAKNEQRISGIISYGEETENAIDNSFAVINLAGAGIGDKRWTNKRKDIILSSRTETTKYIIKTINSISNKPEVYLQGSAIGFYPFSRKQVFNESSPSGNSFLSEVCKEWEKASENLSDEVRRIIFRTGVVLSEKGGMLPKLLRPVKLFAGAIIGKNDQWISWIHISDEISAIKFLMENDRLEGIFNLTSPNPETLNGIIRLTGKFLKRPVLFYIPNLIIRLIFGQMGVETILSGNRVLPERLLKAGYGFSFPDIEKSLKNLLSIKPPS